MKTVTVNISYEHRKKLKELSLESGNSIQECLSIILDKHFKSKNFQLCSDNGMFIWAKHNKSDVDGSKAFEEIAGVQSLSGSMFGSSDNFFRINCGCHREDFDALIERIKKLK